MYALKHVICWPGVAIYVQSAKSDQFSQQKLIQPLLASQLSALLILTMNQNRYDDDHQVLGFRHKAS